jgi:hypothetical protein
MNLENLILTVALWCAPEAFKQEMGKVNVCREQLMACVQAAKTPDKDEKIMACFQGKKI